MPATGKPSDNSRLLGLEQAYRDALYSVQAGVHRPCFRIGLYNAQAEAQLSRAAGPFQAWAIITPCNPGSVALCAHENAARLENLRHWLAQQGYRWLDSSNHDAHGPWPDEPGMLVLDIPLTVAISLGRELGQLALVVARRGAAPELVWVENQAQGSQAKDEA